MTVARTKEEGREAVEALVAAYSANRTYFRSAEYDEASTRTHFIDRLFEALGWDVTSSSPDRDVLFHARHRREASVAGDEEWDSDLTPEELDARASRVDVPDYAFRLDGDLKFYVEAKRPHTGITGFDAIFQVKSYAWNRRLAFSVLTDFDRLKIFRTTTRPNRDRPSVGLIEGFDLQHSEYVARWDDLWGFLSRESVAAGVQAAALSAVRGAIRVDEAFLRDLESWREQLGNDILRRHPDLEMFQLDDVTQRILDRLVFIRVIEDRDVEPTIVLRRYARMSDAYAQLCREFRRLDVAYNGQLFGEHYSERLEVSDGVLQRIIAGLYAVDGSPYRFDTFQADFLGQVYERFLGKEFVRNGQEAKLETKPEVRHAGGVYYTPRWVVEHMVAMVLEPILSGHTPDYVSQIKILDPACGSGTFLLGALDYLIRWHEEYYYAHPGVDPTSHYLDADGHRRLTSDSKSRLLTNNIYGVDLDPQAVEVAQMSLYLRVLEEETAATLSHQPRLFSGAVLPSLSQNIRSGNSLLSEADLPESQASDHDLRRRVNPFAWDDDRSGFGAVFSASGGFDVVLGNPPYTRVQVLRRFKPEETAAMEARYVSATAGFDIASLFTEKGLQLLKPPERRRRGGVLAYITSRTFIETDAGSSLRRILSGGRHIEEIVDFGAGRVFAEAGAYTLILKVAAKSSPTWRLTRVPEPPNATTLQDALRSDLLSAEMRAGALTDAAWSLALPAEELLLQRLEAASPSLREVSGNSIFQGVVTGADAVFRAAEVPDEDGHQFRPLALNNEEGGQPFESAVLRPVYAGRSDFRPFWTAKASERLIFPYSRRDASSPFSLMAWDELEANAPTVARWLKLNEELLRARAGAWTDANWFSYSRRQNLEKFHNAKVMVPSMIDHLCACYDEDGHFFVNVSTGGYGIEVDTASGVEPEFLAALLNSELLSWVLKRYSRAWRGGWFEARKGNLERLPIRIAEPNARRDLIHNYRGVRAAVSTAGANPEDEGAQRVARTAREAFDHQVFALYGLSYEEISLVQG